MATTTSNSPLRKQASAAVDTVAADIQNAARQELDSLRNTVNVRLAALERALGREGSDPAFEAIVEKLCDVAAEQTDAACTWTRAQLEDAAAKELTTVRARAKADLDRVQADLDAATALMDETRADFEQRLAKADAAAVDAARTLAEFKARTEVTLRDGEQRFAQSDAARMARRFRRWRKPSAPPPRPGGTLTPPRPASRKRVIRSRRSKASGRI